MVTNLVFCIDGFGPEYLAQSHMPVLRQLARAGVEVTVDAVVPTVTNVNNVSLVTGKLPRDHGITGNFYLDRQQGTEHYMEAPELILAPTLFERCRAVGQHTVLLTVKDKLRTLIGRDADVAVSAERPESWIVDRIGPPPDVYSVDVSLWLFRALLEMLEHEGPLDFAYLATSDYPMHTFAPEDAEAQRYLYELDALLGQVTNAGRGEMCVALTADHGMNAKARAVDPQKVLATAGIECTAIPIIKDRYVVHHSNLGGSAYVYVPNADALDEAMAVLRETPGLEAVLRTDEAAARFGLHPDRIGDLMLLGEKDTVFGTLYGPVEETSVRSHGSLHEQRVPLIASGPGASEFPFERNLDVVHWLLPGGDGDHG